MVSSQISPLIIEREMMRIANLPSSSVDGIVVTAPSLGLLKIRYETNAEDIVVELSVTFPEEYPLRAPSVQWLKKVGIPDETRRRWELQIIKSSSLLEGLKLWKKTWMLCWME